ncbi:MAG: hydrogenase expression/formation protein HypE [Armatimonadetes bacterium]|nr:hydrogenase expression/formation protein HypE [Armatimonadota bacterium]
MSTQVVLLGHGGGGRLMAELIERVFLPRLGSPELARGDDSAVLPYPGGRLAFTTDSFVVEPVEFPGGDIGRLAVCGTVNDLAAGGAVPRHLSAAFILEEGLPLDLLGRLVASMAATAREAGVRIVAGDTKVVPHGKADRIFITTSGVGPIPDGIAVSGRNARPGDAVLCSGALGDHGMAVMVAREGLGFAGCIESDVAPLNGLVQTLHALGPALHVLRDPTRGGAAAALNEIAAQSGVAIRIEEGAVPVRDPVRVACELLGMDPLYVANEGKMLAIVAPEAADAALAAWRAHPLGREAVRLGEVLEGPAGRVTVRTAFGTHRVLDRPLGEQLPRIC